jgi:hypothetical protein
MYPYDIIFKLNNDEKFIVELDNYLEKLPCYCFIPVVFFIKQQGYVLSDWGLPEVVQDMRNSLVKALKNELQLHESISRDIGYLENINFDHDNKQAEIADQRNEDYWQPHPDLVYMQDGVFFFWVGSIYKIWGHHNLATWIYNDKQGNIIFEITPRYPGLFAEDKSVIKISFEEWMKTYKPFIVRIISPEVAHQWIEQADKVTTYIEEKWTKSEAKVGDSEKMVYEECPRNKR